MELFSKSISFIVIVDVCVGCGMRGCVCMHGSHVEVRVQICRVSSVILLLVGARDQTRSLGLCNKCFWSPSHLTNHSVIVFMYHLVSIILYSISIITKFNLALEILIMNEWQIYSLCFICYILE